MIRITPTLLLILLMFAVTTAAHALPADLDTSFSGDGKVTTPVGANGRAHAVAIQSDGKIVVAGAADGRVAVVRYTAAGALDSGTLASNFGVPAASTGIRPGIAKADVDGAANAVAIQNDGKIVVGASAGNSQLAVVRFNANGTLDNTFGSGGVAILQLGPEGSGATGLAIQPDGRIVVAGDVAGNGGRDIAVARLDADGVLDTSFGPTPTHVTILDISAGSDTTAAVLLAPDSRILVAGSSAGGEVPGCGVGCFVLARFSSAGVFLGFAPASFGDQVGVLATAMTIQEDGKVVVVGTPGTRLVRYDTTNSALDSTFGENGFVEILGFPDEPRSVAMQPDGKIVVAGSASPATGTQNADVVLLRLNANGTLDTNFNGTGRIVTDFSANATTAAQRSDFGTGVTIQRNDGRIVVAGTSRLTFAVEEPRFAVARYHAFTCNGANVTILGTSAPDTIFGRIRILPGPPPSAVDDFDDVILGLGGSDVIDGLGGDDTICGGADTDTLRGNRGNDVLVDGRDAFDGGPGTDVCVGRIGIVNGFVSCETVNTGFAGLSGEWLEVRQHCHGPKRHPACTIRGALRVFNPGTESTALRTSVAFYLSDDAVLDSHDTLLTTGNVRPLAAGDGRVVKLDVRLRGVGDLSGLFVIAVVDALDQVAEVNEANNVVVSPPIGR